MANADSAVQVAVGLSAADFKTGAAQIADAMNNMVKALNQALGTVPAATRPANEAVDGLAGTLAKFKAEQTTQGRQARFFADELASIVPVSGQAADGLRGMIGAALELAGGISQVAVGMALFEVAKVVIGAFRASSEEAAKAAAEFTKELTKMHDEAAKTATEVHALKLEMDGFTPAMVYGAQSVQPAEMALSDLTDAAERQRAAIAKLREENLASLAATGVSADDGSIDRAEATLAGIEAKIRAQEAQLAQRRAKFQLLVGKEEQEGGKAAGKDADKAAKDKAKELAEIGRLSNEAAWKFEEEDAARREASAKKEIADETALMAALWKLEEDDAARRMEIEKRQAEDRKKMAQDWMNVGASIGESVGAAFASVIKGTASVGQAMKALGASILNTIIEMVKKIVMANAVSAAAGAASSQAGIPVVGPVLAASAVVAMLSLVQGLIGDMPSAAGGWSRVPYDTIAMVHQDEKILPKDEARALDRMLANGGGGGSVNITINATDAKSVRRLLLDNGSALAEAIAKAQKDGRLS